MALKAVQKGKTGEQELAREFNVAINRMLVKHQIPVPPHPICQRNQNQSAVGGDDLIGMFGLSVEVKRQETLSVELWWRQVCIAAQRKGQIPILIYRQNNKKWQVVMNIEIGLPRRTDGITQPQMQARATIQFDTFMNYFRHRVDIMLSNGYRPTA